MSEENISLPVAQALASALEKIEAYVPTEYVDNSEPDIDAEHLNHAEQGIMRVTKLLNAAVDVIQGQESRLADAETKIGTAALTGGMTDLSSGLNALNSDLLNIKIATYTMACGIQQSGTTMPFKTQTGLDLIAQADYPKGCKLIVPLCAYNGDKFAVIGLTSNRYLNLNGDNLTYTCVVAYLYSD